MTDAIKSSRIRATGVPHWSKQFNPIDVLYIFIEAYEFKNELGQRCVQQSSTLKGIPDHGDAHGQSAHLNTEFEQAERRSLSTFDLMHNVDPKCPSEYPEADGFIPSSKSTQRMAVCFHCRSSPYLEADDPYVICRGESM